jgi:hypothetical protein
MNPSLSAYLKFKVDDANPRVLSLPDSFGKYRHFKNLEKKFIKLKFTFCSDLFLYFPAAALKTQPVLIHTLNKEITGIAHFDTADDAVLAIIEPNQLTAEFFISEGNKGASLFIYQKYLSGDLDSQVSNFRMGILKTDIKQQTILIRNLTANSNDVRHDKP